ncbi:MAG: Rha family transcriptional regulator [Selenomonadaceae bacterium]|nr:Rha family transcriptional regulator [Selenomonadaceae bacterium]MBQ9497876.1 Rha family transcriptional regulator [Selenomonadaceae bacterium]
MKELVFLQNEQVLTTSLKVAEYFEKRHDRVLRAISASIQVLPKNGDSGKAFIKSSYDDETGKTNPMYLLNRDGFMFVVMGFTGKKAAELKWNYIQEFNRMEQKIIQLIAERKSEEWRAIRQAGK